MLKRLRQQQVLKEKQLLPNGKHAAIRKANCKADRNKLPFFYNRRTGVLNFKVDQQEVDVELEVLRTVQQPP
ncbi:hypothetical protein Tco_0736689 [Tanacetum coccineum]